MKAPKASFQPRVYGQSFGCLPRYASHVSRFYGGSYTRTMLTEGSVAPAFTLPDQNGDRVSLSDFRGRWLVLFWFPKAFTSG
jgi:hypothetical protein